MQKENKPAFDVEPFKKQAAARLNEVETSPVREGVFTPLIKKFLAGIELKKPDPYFHLFPTPMQP